MDRKISVLTYNVPHRKTYDTLCLLKARGYEDVSVFAQPMKYVKKRQPLIVHRPALNVSIPDTKTLCANFGYTYEETDFSALDSDSVFLLCGAGLLPDEFVKSHTIINSHPGFVPKARGLDSYKWSVWYGIPIGATTHIIGKYIDAGEIIERRMIEIKPEDTFHTLALRLYETEIDMLVTAIEKIDEEHEMIIPEETEIFKRMPEETEEKLLGRFEEYKREMLKEIK